MVHNESLPSTCGTRYRHWATDTLAQGKPLTPVLARWNWFDWPLAPSSVPPAGVNGASTPGTTSRLEELELSHRNLSLAAIQQILQAGEYTQICDLALWHPTGYLMLSWIFNAPFLSDGAVRGNVTPAVLLYWFKEVPYALKCKNIFNKTLGGERSLCF